MTPPPANVRFKLIACSTAQRERKRKFEMRNLLIFLLVYLSMQLGLHTYCMSKFNVCCQFFCVVFFVASPLT
jgi:hypothetical protein